MNMYQTVVCTSILHNIYILQNDRMNDIINEYFDNEDGQVLVNIYPWLQNDTQGAIGHFRVLPCPCLFCGLVLLFSNC